MTAMDPAFVDRINEVGFAKAAAERGAIVSDGPVPQDFKATWGKVPLMKGRVAHYWTADRPAWLPKDVLYLLRSACGLESHGMHRLPLLGAGNMPLCERCDSKLLGKVRATR